MLRKKVNPYKECPIYETKHFIFRLVEVEDAEDLLRCYSDPKSIPIFNSDNCTNSFVYNSIEEMRDAINFWIREYKKEYYVRFCIRDKMLDKGIGTIEIFAKEDNYSNFGKVGIFRLDLESSYEQAEYLEEILDIIDTKFCSDFGIESIMTKAVPLAKSRIILLKDNSYFKLEDTNIISYSDYYIKKIDG